MKFDVSVVVLNLLLASLCLLIGFTNGQMFNMRPPSSNPYGNIFGLFGNPQRRNNRPVQTEPAQSLLSSVLGQSVNLQGLTERLFPSQNRRRSQRQQRKKKETSTHIKTNEASIPVKKKVVSHIGKKKKLSPPKNKIGGPLPIQDIHVGEGVLGHQQGGLQNCPGLICSRQHIPPKCERTPLQPLGPNQGMCLGCPIDVCTGITAARKTGGVSKQNRAKRLSRKERRRRRRQRRLCRRFNICGPDADRISQNTAGPVVDHITSQNIGNGGWTGDHMQPPAGSAGRMVDRNTQFPGQDIMVNGHAQQEWMPGQGSNIQNPNDIPGWLGTGNPHGPVDLPPGARPAQLVDTPMGGGGSVLGLGSTVGVNQITSQNIGNGGWPGDHMQPPAGRAGGMADRSAPFAGQDIMISGNAQQEWMPGQGSNRQNPNDFSGWLGTGNPHGPVDLPPGARPAQLVDTPMGGGGSVSGSAVDIGPGFLGTPAKLTDTTLGGTIDPHLHGHTSGTVGGGHSDTTGLQSVGGMQIDMSTGWESPAVGEGNVGDGIGILAQWETGQVDQMGIPQSSRNQGEFLGAIPDLHTGATQQSAGPTQGVHEADVFNLDGLGLRPAQLIDVSLDSSTTQDAAAGQPRKKNNNARIMGGKGGKKNRAGRKGNAKKNQNQKVRPK